MTLKYAHEIIFHSPELGNNITNNYGWLRTWRLQGMVEGKVSICFEGEGKVVDWAQPGRDGGGEEKGRDGRRGPREGAEKAHGRNGRVL